jgi:hypothetical protein
MDALDRVQWFFTGMGVLGLLILGIALYGEWV